MKDTNNLFDYNVWSCGDYNENTKKFNGSLSITNEYSTMGDYCLKLENKTTTLTLVNSAIPSPPHTQYTLKCNVYIIKGSISVVLRDDTWGNTSLWKTPNGRWEEVEITYTTASSASAIVVQFNKTANSEFYVDDICLIKG